MTHYRAFIEVAKGLGTTQEDLQHADSQLDALLADLPALSAACEQFAKSTAAYTARRAESKQLLSKRAVAMLSAVLHGTPHICHHNCMRQSISTANQMHDLAWCSICAVPICK